MRKYLKIYGKSKNSIKDKVKERSGILLSLRQEEISFLLKEIKTNLEEMKWLNIIERINELIDWCFGLILILKRENTNVHWLCSKQIYKTRKSSYAGDK